MRNPPRANKGEKHSKMYHEERSNLLDRIRRVEDGAIRLNKAIALIIADYDRRIFNLKVDVQTQEAMGQLSATGLSGWRQDIAEFRRAKKDLEHTGAELRSFRGTALLLRRKVDLVPEGLPTLSAGISLLKTEAGDVLRQFSNKIPTPEAAPVIDQLQIMANELTDELEGFEVAVNRILESVQG